MQPAVKRILILEDDYHFAKSLRLLLQSKVEVEVEWTDCVSRCLDLIDSKAFDILLVDWLLPNNETGLDVVDYVQEFHSQIKILMLTRQDKVKQRLQAYHKGVDVYLSKPFNAEELLIKVRQLFNQYKLSDNQSIQYKGLTLYPNSGRLLVDQQAVSIGLKETEILKLLLVNGARILSKEKILNLVWPDLDNQPGLNTVEVYIRRLRQKLGPYSQFLKNKRSFGYYFVNGKEQ